MTTEVYLLCILIVLCLLLVGLHIRSVCVLDERARVLIEIEKVGKDRKDVARRTELFAQITNEQMILQFWRPIRSFYKDHECLK